MAYDLAMNRILLVLLATVAVGVMSRTYRTSSHFWNKQLGDILYAVAAYLMIVLTLRRRPIPDSMTLAFFFCVGIELFKLTAIPYQLRGKLPCHWLLGTTFDVYNIVFYLAGVALIAIVDSLLLRPKKIKWGRLLF